MKFLTYQEMQEITPDLANRVDESYRQGWVFALDQNNHLLAIPEEEATVHASRNDNITDTQIVQHIYSIGCIRPVASWVGKPGNMRLIEYDKPEEEPHA